MKTTTKLLFLSTAFVVVGAAGFWAGRTTGATAESARAQTRSGPGGANPIEVTGGLRKTISGPSQSGETITLGSLLRAKGKPDAAKLAQWAANLSPDECAAMMSQLQGMPAGLQRDAILSAVVESWAGRDPQGFLAITDKVGIPRVREAGVNAALKAWAATDPQAALAWIKENPGSASTAALQNRFASAIAGMATTNPKGAFEAVTSLGEDSARDRLMKNTAMKGLADSLADQGLFSDALTMFGTLPAGKARDDAFNQLTQRWAEAAPQDASAWVASLPDPQERLAYGTSVARAWAANDPAGAAAWAAEMDKQFSADPNNPQSRASGRLLATAIQTWATYDFNAPGEFLNQLPASPTKDSAVAIFALRTSQEDPQSAVQWINTISDEPMRQAVSTGVAFQILAQDPANFAQNMATSNLLNEQQKQQLANLPPQALAQIAIQMNTVLGGSDGVQRLMESSLINGGGLGGRGLGGAFRTNLQGGGNPGGNAGARGN